MKKTILLSFLLAGGISATYAQDTAPVDAPAPARTAHVFEHQVGVQMNELIRQIFNVANNINNNNNNNNNAATNPFLLTYTITHAKTGWGLRLGGGYNQDGIRDNDGITNRDTKAKQINFRAGLEKRFTLSKRWSTGVGADFVYQNDHDETKSIISSNTVANITTSTTTKSMGAGAMAWLRFHLSKNVLIGTETSFYYRQGTVESTMDFDDFFGSGVTFPPTTATSDYSEGVFSVPTVFYLIVKF